MADKKQVPHGACCWPIALLILMPRNFKCYICMLTVIFQYFDLGALEANLLLRMWMAALSGFFTNVLEPASAPYQYTVSILASALARRPAFLPSPRIFGSSNGNLPNNSFTPQRHYVIRNSAEHGRFLCIILLIQTGKEKPIGLLISLKSKTF